MKLFRMNGFIIGVILVIGSAVGSTESGLLVWEKIHIPELPDAAMELGCGNIQLSGRWKSPALLDGSSEGVMWKHVGRDRFKKVLPPYAGEVIEDRYAAAGMEVVRQVWVSKAKDCVAVRETFLNKSEKAIRLDTLIPWQSVGDDSITLGEGIDSSRWELIVQAWRKNGCPQAVIPESGWSRDVDQFMLLRGRSSQTLPTLRMGYLEQMGHFAQLRTEFMDVHGKTQLKEITARCLFDGCEVPVGGARTSNWLMFTVHEDPGESMHEYAERVANYYGLPKPGQPPTVWCSWYYYGSGINEQNMNEILDYLEKTPLPYDVIQLDDGWHGPRGNWYAGSNFPSGMKVLADRIRSLGYQPGIWTAPFLVYEEAQLFKEHPEWMLRREDGTFHRGNGNACVLDPTYPGVCEFLEETYRRLTFDLGYTYHKLDFTRAVIRFKTGPRIKYYNPAVTRIEAYRLGMEAVRRGMGPDAVMNVCGGNYGGALGLAQSQRNGGDVRSYWMPHGNSAEEANSAFIRSWMNRLWHTDADSMMVRREEKAVYHRKLSVGLFTDKEAKTTSLKQYLVGGIVILTENLNDIDADRMALYKHVIPSLNSPGIVLDPFRPICASKVLTRITPKSPNLPNWVTIATMNWEEEDMAMQITLSKVVVKSMPAERYLVSEFYSQDVLGLFNANDMIDLGMLKAHHSRLYHVAPWNGKTAVLAGTDLHYSGGGAEITEWQASADDVQGRLETDWRYPVKVTVAFPTADSYVLKSMTLSPGQKDFCIFRPTESPVD